MIQTRKPNWLRTSIALVVAVMALGACAQKKEGASVSVRGPGARAQQGVIGLASGGVSIKGVVYGQGVDDNQFRSVVAGYLNASMPENYVGYVSPTLQNNTGVYIGGRVQLQSGNLNNAPMNGQQIPIHPNSRFLVVVYDSWPNQTVDPIPVFYQQAAGYVQGNRALIQFSDQYGAVQLDGQFDGQYFTGSFKYQNDRTYDGSGAGGAGTLGQFQIATCDFFVCN